MHMQLPLFPDFRRLQRIICSNQTRRCQKKHQKKSRNFCFQHNTLLLVAKIFLQLNITLPENPVKSIGLHFFANIRIFYISCLQLNEFDQKRASRAPALVRNPAKLGAAARHYVECNFAHPITLTSVA